MKKILLLFLVFTLFSCKEKTYEELEAEVLCDVLPGVAIYEFIYFSHLTNLPEPQSELDSLKYSHHQIDSIINIDINNWKKYELLKKQKSDSLANLIKDYKKVEIGIIDTLRFNRKWENDRKFYKFDSLDVRKLDVKEFTKCNLKVNLINYKDTFEGEDRNSDNPLFFLTRVLIDEKKQNAFFSVVKMYGTYYVLCKFSDDKQKWEISEIL